MGLLDGLLSTSGDDQQGLLGLHLLAAAGPRATPASFGQRLLEGLGGYKAQQAAEEDRRQRQEFQRAQMAEIAAQAQQRQAQADAARLAAERQRAFQTALAQQFAPTSPQQALTGGGGPTPENAARIGATQGAPNWQALAAQFPEQIDHLKKLAEARDYGAPEVARTIEGRDAQGRPVTLQFDKQGRQIGAGVQQWKAPEKVDTGGQVQFVDPVTLAQLGALGKTQSPDSAASNAVAWANNALARQRLAFDQQQPKGQYDAERGVMIDTRSGQATPVTMGGAPLGPKNKDLTDSQAKALLFGQRAAEADKILRAMSAAGEDMPGLIKQSADATPMIGGLLGRAVNALPPVLGGPNDNQQSVEQAQRDFINAVLRRESGAVISEPEFNNARQQYFAQVGDSPQVKAQKARNRAMAYDLMLREVPAAQRGMQAPPTPAGSTPSLDDLLKKYGG